MNDQLNTATQAATPPGPSSAFGRLVRVFYEPSKVFAEIATRPTWLFAVLVMVLVALAAQLVLAPKIDWDGTIREQLASRSASANLSEAEMARAVESGRKIASVTGYAAPVLVPIVLLVMAGVYFLGLKAFSSQGDFKQVFSMVTHALLPATLVGALLRIVISFTRSSFTAQEIETLVKSSLASFLSADAGKAVKALAGFVDLFVLWQVVLLALGLAIVGKVRKGQAWTILAVVWGIWILGKVALAAIF